MAPKKGGLGRGLGALLGDLDSKPISIFEENKKNNPATAENKSTAKTPVETVDKVEKNKLPENVNNDFAEGVIYVSIDDIKPNSKQPRKVFNEEALEELANSIKEYGVIQPILVRQKKNAYELVAGERRWRAARKAGLKKIPAIVRELTEQQNSLIALLENMQREDLNIIEEAQGIESLMQDYGLTQEEAAKAVGKSRPYVTNALRLLKLPQFVRDMVESGELSTGHAKAIVGLEGEKTQIEVAKKAAAEGWSVRKIEGYSSIKKKRPAKKSKNAAFKEVEEKMSQHMGTKIKISGSETKGKIEIEYYSRLELDRLIDILTEE